MDVATRTTKSGSISSLTTTRNKFGQKLASPMHQSTLPAAQGEPALDVISMPRDSAWGNVSGPSLRGEGKSVGNVNVKTALTPGSPYSLSLSKIDNATQSKDYQGCLGTIIARCMYCTYFSALGV